MNKKKLLLGIALSIWFIFICDLIARHFFLYWRLWWFDLVMHFMGGLWLSFVGYYFYYFSGWKKHLQELSFKERKIRFF